MQKNTNKATKKEEKAQKPQKPQRAPKAQKQPKAQKPVKAAKAEKPVKAAKAEKPQKTQKPQRAEKASRPARANKPKKIKPTGKLRIIPLGGLGEIGKNITVIEYENDMIVVDCGLGFPDEDMPGIDLVIPDFAYLEANKEKIRGVFLTHGHEDHIGAVPYLLRSLNPPIYGTPLTLGIIKNKLEEHILQWEPRLMTVNAGDRVRAGAFEVEFIHVNHSIADACALCIRTPYGNLIHTGDFKLDTSPIDGGVMDIVRLGELGREGVLMLMCESTNAERPGHTPSERKVGASLEYIFNTHEKKRIIIATFSSNVHRVQQIIDTSVRHKRRVAITGRSMLNIVSAATELGYMRVPEGVLVDLADLKRFKPGEVTIITTGSQGEPMSALYRMAFSDHNQISLDSNDLVVLSSSAIPGNEKLVGRIVNELARNEIEVVNDSVVEVHVSGHACQEEIKLMQALTKPKYYMPVHGESRHLAANRELARYMGMQDRDIFLSEIGKVLEIDSEGARFAETVPAGKVLVDGYGVGDVGNIVLRDRRHLAQDGLIVVVATVDTDSRMLLSGPDLVSRGFVYVREAEDMMEEARQIASDAILNSLSSRRPVDRIQLKRQVKDDLTKYFYTKTRRKPMILPVIMNV